MFDYKRLIYTWISFHGITDILYPIYDWLPYYIISPISIFIPMNILNAISIFTSAYHFSYDLSFLNFNTILLGLFIFISLGKYKWSQNIILMYMSIIHVPLHFYNLTYYDYELLICTFVLFYDFDFLYYNIKNIIESGGRLPNNNIHKFLLGIINAHILTNL